MSGGSSLDRAKSKRQHLQAAEAACGEILALNEDESGPLEGHLLLKVFTDEIVRSLVIDLMQSGGYESRSKLTGYLGTFLNDQGFPPELHKLVEVELSNSLGKFDSQLTAMVETTRVRREGGFKEVAKKLEEIYPHSRGSYEQETYLLENGNVELTANPSQSMTLDPLRISEEFGEEISQGFPFEINIKGLTFMVDYDGSYFYYGQEDDVLSEATQTLAARLGNCSIVDE